MSTEGMRALRQMWDTLELGRSTLLPQKTAELPKPEEVLGVDFLQPEKPTRRKRSTVFEEPDAGGVTKSEAGGY